VLGALSLAGGCGDDDDDEKKNEGVGGSPEQVGKPCEAPADCFPNVKHEDLKGKVECLDRVRGGYCTHQCATDGDCCAIEGECDTDLEQVCAPFESTGLRMCFLSCDSAHVPSGTSDQEYCQREASPDFICRSSGGGDPRKICVPGACGVGAGCADGTDCAAGLECVTEFRGGYCTKRNCSVNADCPKDSLCVSHSNGKNYCYPICTAEFNCSFCRHPDFVASCRDDVDFAVAGTTGKVCVPPS
jgi:hypothetical protein